MRRVRISKKTLNLHEVFGNKMISCMDKLVTLDPHGTPEQCNIVRLKWLDSTDRPAQEAHDLTSDIDSYKGPVSDLRPRLILGGLAILVLTAPLFTGGLNPLPRLLLEWLGLGLIGLALWRPEPGRFSAAELALLGAVFLLPLLYLIPWPAWMGAFMPGREPYQSAIATVTGPGLEAARPLSLHPFATESAWITTLIPLGVYLGTRSLAEDRAMHLVYLLFAVALIQVLIALFQFATATSGVEYGPAELIPHGGSGAGTYSNRNHLAGLLEMVFPLALALFLFHFGRAPHHDRRPRGWRKQALAALQAGGRPSLVFVLLAMLFVVGIVVTRSRSGIAMAMLGLCVTAILFARNLGGRASLGLVGRLSILAIGFAVALGLAPVLDRFATSDMAADARWPLATATFDGAGRRLPLGSGPGTYPDAFPVDQPVALGQYFINHAHNDYLEALYELGLWAPLLLLAFLGLYARQWSRLATTDEWSVFRCLQVGAGVGLLLMLGHSLTDYNLHTPANLAGFALLAGLFFSPPGRQPVAYHRTRHERRTRRMDETAGAPIPPDPLFTAQPDQGQRARNPFDP